MSNLHIVILAAGRGVRMHSDLPKALVSLANTPLIHYVLAAAQSLEPAQIHVVEGHRGDDVRAACADKKIPPINWVHQDKQLGTGHAVAQALPHIPDKALVMVLYSDVPLIRVETLQALMKPLGDAGGLALLTTRLSQPSGYSRIVRDASGAVKRIVEERDASSEEKRLDEVNTGTLACSARNLKKWVGSLGNANASGEYYLTDVIELAVQQGGPVRGIEIHSQEAIGINSAFDLAHAEQILRAGRTHELMERGVRMADPARVDIRGRLVCGKDVFIDINTVFEGEVVLNDGVVIEPNAIVRSSYIGAHTRIRSGSVVEGTTTGAYCEIGPFACLQSQTILGEKVIIGNFVEIKRSTIGDGSKAKHTSYIGDAQLGRGVNMGAGTVTCNYDGEQKHQTIVEDGAFVGSGSQLVAPVNVGREAYIGAGSVITSDAPPGRLTLSRATQETRETRHKDGTAKPQTKN